MTARNAQKSGFRSSRRPLIEGLENRRLLSASSSVVPIDPTPPIIVPIATPVTATTIYATTGVKFSGIVGVWHVKALPTAASGLKATAVISWGDGTSSVGTFVPASPVVPVTNSSSSDIATPVSLALINIVGTHTYAKAGTYKTTVNVSEAPIVVPGKPTPQFVIEVGQAVGKAIVTNPPPVPTPVLPGGTGVTLKLTAGVSFTGSVGSFTYGSAATTTVTTVPAGLTATISWGDGATPLAGTASVGKIVSNGKGGFNVIGTHTYAKAGTYHIFVTVEFRPVVKPGQPVPEFIAIVANWASTADVTAPPVATPQ